MFVPFALLAASKAADEASWHGLGFPRCFIGMWLLVCFILSRMAWVRFARAYPCPACPAGNAFLAPFACFGSFGPRYKNVVSAIACEGGLHLRVILFFRAFHTPFLLPWSSVARIEPVNGWLIKGHTLYIRDPKGSFQIRFRQSFESELRRFVPALMEMPAPHTFPAIKTEAP